MTGIILQARLGSTRLPGKMILPFYKEKGILELLIENLSLSFKNIPIIIATTVNDIDDQIYKLATKKGVYCFRGSENNVLERFTEAARHYKLTKIIRVCADNPFLSMYELKKLIKKFENSDYDYLSYQTSNDIPAMKTHYGLWAEAMSFNALQKIDTTESLYLEHVTNYIYEHPERYNIDFIKITKENNYIRLTTDTKEDFLLNKEIYAHLIEQNIVEVNDLIEYISQNENWISRMKMQIETNLK